MSDLIDRQAAIATAVRAAIDWHRLANPQYSIAYCIGEAMRDLPSAQPEITDEQAIEHLQSTGWMQNHDREMYESGLREQLADDSGAYDSLVSCEYAISRQAAIDALRKDPMGGLNYESILSSLPSAQPEIIRCKECKYWKDSDGVYRRGFDAESKCPLNLKKVYEGTFYCGMAERRTDE